MSPGSPNAPDERDARRGAAIDVDHVSKAFRLPHERRTTLKEYFLHPLRRIDYEEQRALRRRQLPGRAGRVLRDHRAERQRQEHAAQDHRRHLPSRTRERCGSNGLLSPFIELGVGFNPELTARDNIRINGTLLGLDRRQLSARYDDIVAFSELERFVDQKLKNFSSGMQVRLAYAIAIQVDFDILLLDEVLAVGDESFQQKCFETFDALPRGGKDDRARDPRSRPDPAVRRPCAPVARWARTSSRRARRRHRAVPRRARFVSRSRRRRGCVVTPGSG